MNLLHLGLNGWLSLFKEKTPACLRDQSIQEADLSLDLNSTAKRRQGQGSVSKAEEPKIQGSPLPVLYQSRKEGKEPGRTRGD